MQHQPFNVYDIHQFVDAAARRWGENKHSPVSFRYRRKNTSEIHSEEKYIFVRRQERSWQVIIEQHSIYWFTYYCVQRFQRSARTQTHARAHAFPLLVVVYEFYTECRVSCSSFTCRRCDKQNVRAYGMSASLQLILYKAHVNPASADSRFLILKYVLSCSVFSQLLPRAS